LHTFFRLYGGTFPLKLANSARHGQALGLVDDVARS
jgi:hypothetical protein